MNDIELAYKINTNVGHFYEKAFNAKGVSNGSEVIFVRKALEAFVFNALDEYQLEMISNLHENIETMKNSSYFSEQLCAECHKIRRICNEDMHFSTFENNNSDNLLAFDFFEILIKSYYLSIGGALTDYQKLPLESNTLKETIQKLYIDESLDLDIYPSLAFHWFEKHKSHFDEMTGQVTKLGNKFFLLAAASLIEIFNQENDNEMLLLYIRILTDPSLISEKESLAYSLAEKQVTSGDLKYLQTLNTIASNNPDYLLQTAQSFKNIFESGNLPAEFYPFLYAMYSGLHPQYSSVKRDISFAKTALLMGVSEGDVQALRFYSRDLFLGLTFNKDIEQACVIFKQIEQLNPEFFEAFKDDIRKLVENGQIKPNKLLKTELYIELKPFISNDSVGRNTLCPCGSEKKYKKCCGK